ncbi:hypothetical protein [Pseudonocardia sp. TMWB2A]|uniref:hypothetical protein n=1 Tax=Pseudonocardia sp. TMWB2A TaxID=687430 RepID=UPI00307D4DF7
MNMQVKPERGARTTPQYMGVRKFGDLPELCEAKGVFSAELQEFYIPSCKAQHVD